MHYVIAIGIVIVVKITKLYMHCNTVCWTCLTNAEAQNEIIENNITACLRLLVVPCIGVCATGIRCYIGQPSIPRKSSVISFDSRYKESEVSIPEVLREVQ